MASVVIEMPELRTGQLEGQRAVGLLDDAVAPAAGLRALASTVLRSSAVNENSAATNTAVPARQQQDRQQAQQR